MRTILFFVSLLFVGNIALNAQLQPVEIKTKNDYHLKGDVKQVIESHGSYKKKLVFTPEGYLQYDGSLDSSKRGITYSYDKAGRLVKYKMAINANNFQVKTYEYNVKGLMIKYTRDTEENKPYHETYQYDQNGNIQSQIGDLGEPMFEFRNTYDAQKRIIKIEHLFPSSKRLIATTMISYLPNGWSKHIYTSKFEKVISEYDSKGRIRSITKRDLTSDEIYLSITNRYDNNDNLIESKQDEYQTNNTYNKQGELTSTTRKEGEKGLTESKGYSYTKRDAVGNWTERIVNDLKTNKKYTETRVITYYGQTNTPTTTNDPVDAFFGKGNFNVPNSGEFVTDVPNTVAVGEQFRLNYTIGLDNVDNFKAPSLPNFNVLMGPSRSKSTSTEVTNGSKVSTKTSITYTFILQAEKEGSFTIPGATVESEGKTYTSNAVTIKVTSK